MAVIVGAVCVVIVLVGDVMLAWVSSVVGLTDWLMWCCVVHPSRGRSSGCQLAIPSLRPTCP